MALQGTYLVNFNLGSKDQLTKERLDPNKGYNQLFSTIIGNMQTKEQGWFYSQEFLLLMFRKARAFLLQGLTYNLPS